jgi:hypothetical protein
MRAERRAQASRWRSILFILDTGDSKTVRLGLRAAMAFLLLFSGAQMTLLLPVAGNGWNLRFDMRGREIAAYTPLSALLFLCFPCLCADLRVLGPALPPLCQAGFRRHGVHGALPGF